MRRSSRAMMLLKIVAANVDRKPAGDVEITLRNPGCKLVMHVGAPVRMRKFPDPEYGREVMHSECVFRLPTDWVKVEPPEPGEFGTTIVARQVGTKRVLAVQSNGHSEVLY